MGMDATSTSSHVDDMSAASVDDMSEANVDGTRGSRNPVMKVFSS